MQVLVLFWDAAHVCCSESTGRRSEARAEMRVLFSWIAPCLSSALVEGN